MRNKEIKIRRTKREATSTGGMETQQDKSPSGTEKARNMESCTTRRRTIEIYGQNGGNNKRGWRGAMENPIGNRYKDVV